MATILQVGKEPREITQLRRFLNSRVVNQERAMNEICERAIDLYSDFRIAKKPIMSLMFLGPTGVGKTESVKAFAEYLFGNEDAYTHIECESYKHGHNLAALIGAPPGYVGFDDVRDAKKKRLPPLLSQETIDQPGYVAERLKAIDSGEDEKLLGYNPNYRYRSIILFDEIEKAHPDVWTALLSVLDRGKMTLKNGEVTDFTNSCIFFTSNLGAKEIIKIIEEGSGKFGFRGQNSSAKVDQTEAIKAINSQIYDVAKEELKKRFSPEFINRIDKKIAFQFLTESDLLKILDGMIIEFKKNDYFIDNPMIIDVEESAKRLIVKKSYNISYGARDLKRNFQKYIERPFVRLVATGQLKKKGIILSVEADEKSGQFIWYADKKPRALKAGLIY